jgi:hypothetical protein
MAWNEMGMKRKVNNPQRAKLKEESAAEESHKGRGWNGNE